MTVSTHAGTSDRATRTRAGAAMNDLSSLDPEFRARLERVIARMSGELGHSVEVLETYRGQGRQEALFAQGRSAPGPVVTWTRNSLHTLGRAADIRVDGRNDDGDAYRLLRRVAESEGLHTLGSKDPGHVEMLRSSGRSYAWAPPVVSPGTSSAVPGAVMTRIIATGGGSPSAVAAPTVFSGRSGHRSDLDTPDAEAAPATPVPTATAAIAEPAAGERRHVPNADERRRAASATGGVVVASARADDPSSTLDAVRSDATAPAGDARRPAGPR